MRDHARVHIHIYIYGTIYIYIYTHSLCIHAPLITLSLQRMYHARVAHPRHLDAEDVETVCEAGSLLVGPRHSSPFQRLRMLHLLRSALCWFKGVQNNLETHQDVTIKRKGK